MVGPLASIVDAFILGQGLPIHLAQLTLALVWLDALGWIFGFLVHIPTREVSFWHAQKRIDVVTWIGQWALAVGLFLGSMACVVVYFSSTLYWDFQIDNPTLVDGAKIYLLARLFGLPAQLALQSVVGIFRGFGDHGWGLKLPLLSTGLNAGVAIYLWKTDQASLFNLGILSSISIIFALVIGVLRLQQKHHFFSKIILFKKPLNTHKPLSLFSLGKDSLFLFGRSFLVVGTYFATGLMASELTVLDLAAYQILLQMWMMSAYWADGVAIVANTETARLLGKEIGDELRAFLRPILKLGLFVGTLFSGLYALAIFFAWPTIFFPDPLVWSMAYPVLGLIAVAQIPSSLAYVYDGIFFGLKDYRRLLKLMFISVMLGPLPMGILFYNSPSLTTLWLGPSLFNFWRWVLCSFHLSSRHEQMGKIKLAFSKTH